MTQINLPYLAALRASGPDAERFLQAQLTADIESLPDGQACLSAYCDPKGNVLAVTRVIRRGEEYQLIAARELVGPFLSLLEKYVLRARVVLDRIGAAVVGIDDGGEMSYALESAEAPSAPSDAESVEAWRSREIRSGLTWLGPATSGRYLPQMLGLERLGAVSFRKGCFPGQEVIARVHYLAKLKRLPLIVEADDPRSIEVGSELALLSGDATAGTAVVVDLAADGDTSTLFLVARYAETRPVSAVEIDGKRVAVREIAQA